MIQHDTATFLLCLPLLCQYSLPTKSDIDSASGVWFLVHCFQGSWLFSRLSCHAPLLRYSVTKLQFLALLCQPLSSQAFHWLYHEHFNL